MRKFALAGAVFALVPAAASAQVTLQDSAFAQATTHVDLASIQQGQNAVTVAASPAVRSFAQDEVAFHTDENHSLASISPFGAAPLTTTMTPCLTWQTRLVQQTAPPPFDAAYLQATIYNHKRLIDVLQGEIQAGTNPDLKAFAQKQLPAIQAHLAAAQQLLAGGVAAVPSPVTVRPTFASGEWTLTAADQQTLNEVAHRLTGMQQTSITATGYTDTVPIGPELKRRGVPTNQVLSERRAESVAQYLVSQGLPADRITTRGMGPADPVASNATESGRAQNRRVVVAASGGTAAAAPVAGPVAGIPACYD